MIEYTDELVKKMFKKYEMLASSLSLIKEEEQKNNINFELGKILNKVIEETNKEYEKRYNEVKNKDVEGFDEEKTKITLLIELIKDRELFINNLISKHYILTSKRIDEPSFLGKFDLDEYENKIDVINNYLENINLIKKYNDEIEKLDNSISLAKEKIDISNTLNNELEVKFKNVIEIELQENEYLKFIEEKEEIEKIYKELEFIINISEENIKINNSLSYDIDFKEQNEYEEVEELYFKYKEKMVILELIEIYDKKTKNYDELIEKRNKINDIMNKIPQSNIYHNLIDLIKEQYSTLLKQKEDVKTLKTLEEEKQYKISLIEEKIEENNSEIYKDIVEELKKEEEQIREKKLLELKKEEELNRQRMIEEQKERQEEIKRRQKLIEEQRKKEMEERAKKILEEQNKFQKKSIEPESIEKVIIKEEDKMVDNPIFKDIKKEIEYKNLNTNNEDENMSLNSFKNISNILPNDLDAYMKNFESEEKNEDEKIFVEF